MDTTSISELPSNNNITMSQSEMPNQQPPQQMPLPPVRMVPQSEPQMQVEENAANINSVLEKARQTGSLSLPNRDIPIDTTQLTHDNEAHPDFIPNKTPDYIEDVMNLEEIQNKRRKERNKEDSLEELYKELQVPIFIGILYFIFLLPVTNKYFHKFFTFGFREDGQMNIQGYFVKSFIFACVYYILNLFMNRLSEI